MPQREHAEPHDLRIQASGFEGGANPFATPNYYLIGNADSTAEILRLRLQGQTLLGRALEMENTRLREENGRLVERFWRQTLPGGTHMDQASYGRRPLAERIDSAGRSDLPHYVVNEHSPAPPAQVNPLRPPTVTVQPVGIHPRFLPLGKNFQEGGTGGPMFSRPQDWPDAIRQNPSMRPRGVRRWGTHTVNLDDLHVHVQIGDMIYGGNRPPGRRDPVDSQRQWKAIEAAFFREVVTIILQPHLFTEIQNQLTFDECTPHRQPFLAQPEDPNQLATRDVVQHLVQSGITEPWIGRDTVIGFARAYLRDWARHQAEITTSTKMGQLFLDLHPEGINDQNNRQFVEDAATDQEETWGGAIAEDSMQEDPETDPDMPSLEPASPDSPSIPQGSPRTQTPLDERVDYGDD